MHCVSRCLAGGRFHTSIDLLNSYMEEYKFPQQLRESLRMYFIHCRSMRREDRFKTLLNHMSPELQGLVTAHCYAPYISTVPFFKLNLGVFTGYMRVKVEEEMKIFVSQVRLHTQYHPAVLAPIPFTTASPSS